MGLLDRLLSRGDKRGPLAPWAPVSTSWQARPALAALGRTSVRGESYRQDVLLRHAGGRTPGGCRLSRMMAQLVAEPSNKHDPNAIAVLLGSDHVGYISREDTHLFQPV